MHDSLGDNCDILGGRLRWSEDMLIAAPRGGLHMRWRGSVRFTLFGVAFAAGCQAL